MPSRILIIEDNQANLDLMTYLLDSFGYQTMSACDGEAGLEMARRVDVDLIICDIQMPKMSGFEVANRLKAHPALKQIPIIAVTAFAMLGDREKVISAGFDGYIAKPIDAETFVSYVESFLAKLHPEEERRPKQPMSVATQVGLRRNAGRSVRILMADNSSVNIEFVRRALEPGGFEVVAASCVSEGLDLARHAAPALIVSDIHLAEEGGLEFIRKTKSDAQLNSIPFIFLTSPPLSKPDELSAVALGALKVIVRPVDPKELLAQLSLACQRQQPLNVEG